jgi:hypothetical protein
MRLRLERETVTRWSDWYSRGQATRDEVLECYRLTPEFLLASTARVH